MFKNAMFSFCFSLYAHSVFVQMIINSLKLLGKAFDLAYNTTEYFLYLKKSQQQQQHISYS